MAYVRHGRFSLLGASPPVIGTGRWSGGVVYGPNDTEYLVYQFIDSQTLRSQGMWIQWEGHFPPPSEEILRKLDGSLAAAGLTRADVHLIGQASLPGIEEKELEGQQPDVGPPLPPPREPLIGPTYVDPPTGDPPAPQTALVPTSSGGIDETSWVPTGYDDDDIDVAIGPSPVGMMSPLAALALAGIGLLILPPLFSRPRRR